MYITEQIVMLELETEGFGGKDVLHPILVKSAEGTVLIDTGMPGNWANLCRALRAEGAEPEQLTAVVLTHQDLDHVGCVRELEQAGGGRLRFFAHPADRPHIEGMLPLEKTTPERMAPVLAALPEEVRRQALATCANPPSVRVTDELADGMTLPWGGLQVVHTPGHTPGHVSLYHPASKTLLAADAMLIYNGRLIGPVPQTTPDMAEALRSVARLSRLDVERIVCYHGGVYEGNAAERLAELAAAAETKAE